MIRTLYGILILRIPLQPWDHIAFALTNKKRHHQTTASRAIVQSCLHVQRCIATVRIVSILCAIVCCSSGQSASTRSAMHLPCVFTCASLRGFPVAIPPSSLKQHYCNRVTAYTRALAVSNVFAPAMTLASHASGFYDMIDSAMGRRLYQGLTR